MEAMGRETEVPPPNPVMLRCAKADPNPVTRKLAAMMEVLADCREPEILVPDVDDRYAPVDEEGGGDGDRGE
jgi:hypothetical protein